MRRLLFYIFWVLLTGLAADSGSAQANRLEKVQAVPGVGQALPAASDSSFERRFEQAYALSQAGRMSEAAARLEALRKEQPANFKVNELLGLVEAAEGQVDSAVQQLRSASLLEPRSAAAHDNLATALARKGEWAAAQAEWQRALELQPTDPAATRDLARLYLQQSRLHDAVPLLRAAHAASPAVADTTYNLALADYLLGDFSESRRLTTELLQQKNSGEYHSLLGKLDEKEAKYVEAANEFGTAAALDPSEENLFTWGSEFLVHRAYEPAIQVFQQGSQRFSDSPRLWVGLGMALYSRGLYEPAIHALLKAADLNAQDPRCYLFLSKAYLSAPAEADQVIERFRRYAVLQPNNAKAQFYYALSLWKGRRADTESIDTKIVESTFLHSLTLDDRDAETHLQLGIFYNDARLYEQAMVQFQRAQQLDPELADAHFRLGRAYLRIGEKEKAEVEFARFKQLQAQHQAQVDKERAEVQQFVIAMKAPAGSPATQGKTE